MVLYLTAFLNYLSAKALHTRYEIVTLYCHVLKLCVMTSTLLDISGSFYGTKFQLFKAAVVPYLTYSHLVWHFCHASDSRKLERVRERARSELFIVTDLQVMINY